MKFARYLQDTQTPEWKKAYIDYGGLKKRISHIRRAREGHELLADSPVTSELHLTSPNKPDKPIAATIRQTPTHVPPAQSTSAEPRPLAHRPNEDVTLDSSPITPVAHGRIESIIPNHSQPPQHTPSHVSTRQESGHVPSESPGQKHASSLKGVQNTRSKSIISRMTRLSSPSNLSTPHPCTTLPLHQLLPLLSPAETMFFIALDAELDKTEGFYQDREKEMQLRNKMLEDQLKKLAHHRRLYYAAHPTTTHKWSPTFKHVLHLVLKCKLLPSKVRQNAQNDANAGRVGDGKEQDSIGKSSGNSASPRAANRTGNLVACSHVREGSAERDADAPDALDPDDYPDAKKKLQKAVLEHYRGLEVLNNYRILNLTGFRKALKKFEKVTKILALDAYTKEKVEPSGIYSGRTVTLMTEVMEQQFASRFKRGNKKKAMDLLRATSKHRSHHLSTFRSGIFLGLAVPAFVSGLYQSFQPDTRAAISGWEGLLFVYGIFLVPVLFALLVGVNLLVWSQARINYVFIFELDVRTRLDHREYFETPAILLSTLCYAFWLSFMRIGAPSASPTIWPLVWLGLTCLIMLDPLLVLFKPSRYWLLKNIGRLLISGTRRVEFADFWMGDQFCSLIFTLSNLFFVVCAYTGGLDGFDSSLVRCTSSSRLWPVQFALAALPLLARLVQSVKRYADSKLRTHLVNGGKYGIGIISYFLYFHWRHQGSHIAGTGFAFYCLFTIIYSLYASAWDFLMDWSIFQHRAKYPLLRSEFVYSNHIPMYYLAIVSNIAIRFIWIIYIPQGGLGIMAKTFIAGMLEMLRRWQWNFYRLENEHLGNMDQYRVTREVPLPYSFDDIDHEDRDEDGDEDAVHKASWWGLSSG